MFKCTCLIIKHFIFNHLVLIIRKFTLLRQITSSDVKNQHYKNIATRSVSNYPSIGQLKDWHYAILQTIFKNTQIPFEAQKPQEQ